MYRLAEFCFSLILLLRIGYMLRQHPKILHLNPEVILYWAFISCYNCLHFFIKDNKLLEAIFNWLVPLFVIVPFLGGKFNLILIQQVIVFLGLLVVSILLDSKYYNGLLFLTCILLLIKEVVQLSKGARKYRMKIPFYLISALDLSVVAFLMQLNFVNLKLASFQFNLLIYNSTLTIFLINVILANVYLNRLFLRDASIRE